MTAQIWLCRGCITRCRFAAIIGIAVHSWASEKEDMAVAESILGSRR